MMRLKDILNQWRAEAGVNIDFIYDIEDIKGKGQCLTIVTAMTDFVPGRMIGKGGQLHDKYQELLSDAIGYNITLVKYKEVSDSTKEIDYGR